MAGSLLAPLLALAGQCFVGDLGPGSRDQHCFSSMFGGKHVRDVHRVTRGGRTVYEGETIYSVEGPAVTFVYVSSIGGIGRGTVDLGPDDWHFSLTMRAEPGAAPATAASRWKWHGTRSYTVSGGAASVSYRRSTR